MNPNFDYSEDPPSYQASYGPSHGSVGPQTSPVGPQTGPVGPKTGPVGLQTGPVGPQTGPVGSQFDFAAEKSYQNQGPAFPTIPQQEVHYPIFHHDALFITHNMI